MAVLPARICISVSSVHSVFIDSGNFSTAIASIILIASPELSVGKITPLTGAAGYRL